jgi:peptidyl-prolyl cis-trans isomerase D
MKMEDEFASGSTLADVAKAENLTIQATPMLLANGQNPEDPNYRPIPEMERILPIAFSLEEDSDPQVVEIIPGQQYAILAVSQIAAAAPPPLQSIKQTVARDYILEQGSKKAKTVADKIAKQVSSGVALSKALADTNVRLPAVESINSTRANLATQSQKGQVPPPLTLMFSMAEGTAKTLKAPQNQGWFVVSLTNIDPGDASKQTDLLRATSTQFKNVFGNEYTDQFINAMKADVGIKKNDKALSALRSQLMGQQ